MYYLALSIIYFKELVIPALFAFALVLYIRSELRRSKLRKLRFLQEQLEWRERY